jgi:hypothetical protein
MTWVGYILGWLILIGTTGICIGITVLCLKGMLALIGNNDDTDS